VTTGLDSPLDLVPHRETPSTGTVSCARCGKPTWDGVLRVLDEEGVDGHLKAQRRSLALNPGQSLCNDCWAREWKAIGHTYVETLKTEERGSCRLNGLAPFDEPQHKTRPDPIEPKRQDEFVCATCTQVRPKHQRQDDGRCVDCIDATVLPAWRDLAKYPEPPRYWWHCRECREFELQNRLAQMRAKTTWTTPEMDAFDKALPVLARLFARIGRPALYAWSRFAENWTTSCRVCGDARRGRPWVKSEGAHRDCRNEQRRRQRRNRHVAIKPSSGHVTYGPVVHIWDNGRNSNEPSVRADNSSAPATIFVSPRTEIRAKHPAREAYVAHHG
jgi:hypothetical protein